MPFSDNAIMIFTKNPVLGKVKTRLAKTIGDEKALKAYNLMLQHTREITHDLDFCEKKIFYDEFIPAKDSWKEDEYDKYLQGEGDLAVKMNNAFKTIFDEDYSKVVIISPDCPNLTGAKIKQAFALLQKNDFVIGPLEDGGFYLLGMKKYSPEIFESMKFGNDKTLDEVKSKITELGLAYKELNMLSDVDVAEELTPKLRKILGLEEVVIAEDYDEDFEEDGIKPEDLDGEDNDDDDDGYKDEPLDDDED